MELTALIVDDEKIIIDSLTSILKDSGIFISVLYSNDGVDACRKIDNQKFDLLIVDINMPRLDGLGVIKHINESDNHSPEILLISGGFNAENVQIASQFGIKHVLAKPFNSKKFVAKLTEVIKGMKANKAA